VVVRVSVSDSEADGHTIEETDPRWSISFAGEVIAYEKKEFILAGTQFIVSQQWLIRPPLGIGAESFQKRRFLGSKGPEFNLHALGGAAMGCVENVGAEPCRHAKYQKARAKPIWHQPSLILSRSPRASS
jgi:hypothetical protein